MRAPSPNSFAILLPIIVVACGGGSDESSATGPDGASATTTGGATDAASAGSGGSEASSPFDSRAVTAETAAPQDGAAPKDVGPADQAPAILPGSVHVDIDGVRRDFPVVTDDWNLDGTVVSIAASPEGGMRPYPVIITLPKPTATGTVRCGETNVVLLSYADSALGAEWSSNTPCEINLTQAAQKMGERWVGTFSADLVIEVPSDAAPAMRKFTNGVFDVPRLQR